MHLNLPVLDQLLSCQNLLIAGMGGGFDVFCGLPVYFELKQRGQQVHLANYSFSDIDLLKDGIRLTNDLVGVTANVRGDRHVYFPELYLSRWFQEQQREEVVIWSFTGVGVRPLLGIYQTLVEHLSLDGILLIDGGIDSLLRGDEEQVGTIIEDTVSLIAVSELKRPFTKLMACVGLGAERDIAHEHVFENIAKLAEIGAFKGTCSLVKEMEAYQAYESAVFHVFNQPRQDPSVINSSIISAVQGHFGNHHLTNKTAGSRLWISPLMPIYWFFEVSGVARRNLLFSHLRYTDTLDDAFREFSRARRRLVCRPSDRIPLP